MRIIIELIVFAIAVGLTVEVIKSAIPYLPFIWLVILVYYTWKAITSKYILPSAKQFKDKLSHGVLMYSYIAIAIAGVVLFSFYWWGLNSFFAPRIAAYEAEQHTKKTPPVETNPFSVEVRSALVSDSGPLTLFMAVYPSLLGPTASPIFYLVYIRIINQQDIACMINDFKLSASKELAGPWEELVPIPLKSVKLYMLGVKNPHFRMLALKHSTYRLGTPMKIEDMKYAAALNANPILELELTHTIPSHQFIGGWTAFDSHIHKGLSPGQIYFRMTIQDTAGRIGSYITPHPVSTNSTTDFDGGGLLATGGLSDISKYHVKYYSDPFPTLESH
jgi:hypothetical protein